MNPLPTRALAVALALASTLAHAAAQTMGQRSGGYGRGSMSPQGAQQGVPVPPPQYAPFPGFSPNGPQQGGLPQGGYSTAPGSSLQAPRTIPGLGGLPLPFSQGGLMGPIGEAPSWLGMPGVPSATSRPVGRLAPDRFMAARFSDLVEVRPGDEKAYYPLLFWRKVLELGPASSVRSSAAGHLLLVFSDGVRLEHHGRCHLHVHELQPDRVSVAFDELTTLRIAGGTRPARYTLPEGTVLEMKGGQANIECIDDRLLVVRNFASERLLLSSERGTVTLESNQRCVLPLVRNDHPRPPFLAAPEGRELVEYGSGNDAVRAGSPARMDVEGRVLQVAAQGGERSAVRWGGASFRLGPGARLLLDPFLGERFPLSTTPATVPNRKDGASGPQPKDENRR